YLARNRIEFSRVEAAGRTMDEEYWMKIMRVVLSLVIGLAIAPLLKGAPAQASQNRPASKKPASRATRTETSARAPNSLERIRSRADFDRLARIYYRGR